RPWPFSSRRDLAGEARVVTFGGKDPAAQGKLLARRPLRQHEVLVHALGRLPVVGLLVSNDCVVHRTPLHSPGLLLLSRRRVLPIPSAYAASCSRAGRRA